jgi:endo-1,4-beta-xylanase
LRTRLSRRRLIKASVETAVAASLLSRRSTSGASGATKYLVRTPGIARDGNGPQVLPAGSILFVGADPLTAKPLANPYVPPPSFQYTKVVQDTADGRVLALNQSGAALGRARYYAGGAEWRWTADTESVADYTVREYADALGITFGNFGGGRLESLSQTELHSRSFLNLLEKTSNAFIVSFALQQQITFYDFRDTDWRKVLSDWANVSSAIRSGTIPSGFPYNWRLADSALGWCEDHHLVARAEGLLWGKLIPETVRNRGFSVEELWKLLEFMVRVRVLKYRGRIKYWDVESEMVVDILTTPANAVKPEFALANFWYGKLGQYVNENIAAWAHEADPAAILVAVDDNEMETDWEPFRNLHAKYFELLRHYKASGAPIHVAGIENNLWIYARPTKQQMVETIREIQTLGFEFQSTEVTVSIDDVHLWGPGRPKRTNPSDKLIAQAELYRDLLEAQLETGCTVFWLGAESDDFSWFADIGRDSARVALFDEQGKPKPAYFAVLDVLKQRYLTYGPAR